MASTAIETVGIEVVARIDQLRAEMAKIPGVTEKEAKAMVKGLERQLKAAEKAAKKTADETKGLGDAAGKAGQSSAKLAGALSMLGGPAGDAARSVADLADVGEVFADVGGLVGLSAASATVALGALAQAAAAGYVAWRIYAEDGERAAKIADEVAAAHKALSPILDSTRAATIDLAVATGTLTEMEGQLAQNALRAHDSYQQATEATRKRLAELGKEQGSIWTQMADGAESIVPSWTPLGMAIDGLTTDSSELREESDALNATLDEAAAATRANVATTSALIEARTRHATTTREAAAAEDEYAESLGFQEAELRASLASRTAARQEELDAARLAAEEEGRLLMERVAAEQDAAQEAADARADAARDAAAAEIEAAREAQAAVAELAGDIAGYIADAFARVADARADALADTQEAIDEISGLLDALHTDEVDAANLQGEALVEAYRAGEVAVEDLSDAQQAAIETALEAEKAALEEQEAAERDAAERAFEAAKAFQLAQTWINTLSAMVAALTVPPPMGEIAAAAALAAGIAATAEIASTEPSFGDTPGVMAMARGGSVRLAAGDLFAAAQTPAALQQQVGAGAGPSVTVLRIGRREAREIARTDVRAGGIIPQEVRRAVLRGGRRAGLSGREPIA